LVFRADGLPDVLAALARGFGAIAVLPVHPKAAAGAIRVVVNATKGSRTPLALLPPLVLAGDDASPTAAAEAVLRGGAALPIG
jgi:tRNA1(Val) A37 N6-methylase TrmN6